MVNSGKLKITETFQAVVHTIPPVYDEDSRILILGSFPSVKSRESSFFYGHPQNRFWKVLALLFEQDLPQSVEEKKAFLHRNHIALWDVVHSCEISGSSDSSIRNVVENDISVILENSKVERIFTNGATADKLYKKYIYPDIKIMPYKLPSTSPANAAFNIEKLVSQWKKLCV